MCLNMQLCLSKIPVFLKFPAGMSLYVDWMPYTMYKMTLALTGTVVLINIYMIFPWWFNKVLGQQQMDLLLWTFVSCSFKKFSLTNFIYRVNLLLHESGSAGKWIGLGFRRIIFLCPRSSGGIDIFEICLLISVFKYLPFSVYLPIFFMSIKSLFSLLSPYLSFTFYLLSSLGFFFLF